MHETRQQLDELYQAVIQLYQEGRYTEAIPLAARSCELTREALGERHADYATSLNNLAMLYDSLGYFAKAEPLLRQAGEIWCAALGEAHPDFATSLNNLGLLYGKMGRIADAASLHHRALKIRHAVLGEGHRDYASSLNNLGLLYWEMGRLAEAEPLLRQAVEIWRTTLGEECPDYAVSLSNLGMLYAEMGRLSTAEPLVRQGLELRRVVLGEQHPDYAMSLNSLAALYYSMGRFVDAEPLHRQAIEIRRVRLGEEHPDYATSLNNLALLYAEMGRFADAESLYRKAIQIARAVLGENHLGYATSLHNLAALYESMGRFADAELLYGQAIEALGTVLGANHPDYATSLNNLAALYWSMGRYPEAEALFRQATGIRGDTLGDDHPHYATSLNNLAVLYQSMGRYAEAEPLMRQAVDTNQRALGNGHPAYATNLRNLAELYRAMRRFADAEPLYQEALGIERAMLGENHPDHAQSLHNLALLYTDMGRLAEAEALCRQATETRRAVLGENHPSYAQSLTNLAELLAAMDQPAEALRRMEQAAVIEDRMIGQIFGVAAERQRMAYVQTLQDNLDTFLSLVQQHLRDSTVAVGGALDRVLRRKAIGAEVLAAQRDAVLGGRYPHLKPRLEALHLLRSQIARKTLAGPGAENPRAHRQELAEWTAQEERIEGELAREIPEMNLEQQLRAAGRDAVAQHLPVDATLVEFARFNVFDFHARRRKPARYAAFVLPAGRPDDVRMIDLGEAEPIDRMIAALREQLLSSDDRARDFVPAPVRAERELSLQRGRELRAALFDPLGTALGGTTRLLLSPDGDLARLPFEVLPADDGTCLADRFRISYLASGRDVLHFATEARDLAREAGPPVIVADPDFDLGRDGSTVPRAPAEPEHTRAGPHSRDLDRARLHFARLPGTRLEGERIARLLGAEPWLEADALEARLRARRSPRILHLATHGFFLQDQETDPNADRAALGMTLGITTLVTDKDRGRLLGRGAESPLLRSGLALAGVNTWLAHGTPPAEAEDGLLTAEDVTGLDLLDTELVVLSACETGLGEVRVGEGVFGLRRAFVLAGAKTLVMSLWKVPDLATAILMVHFYENLLRQAMKRDEALRAAQRYLRQLTVGEIRTEWLSGQIIERISAGRAATRRELEELARRPDEHRPFAHPRYWGAFICQGETAPLRLSGPPPVSGPSRAASMGAVQDRARSRDPNATVGSAAKPWWKFGT